MKQQSGKSKKGSTVNLPKRALSAALMAGAALTLGACTASPGPVMGKATDKLVSYFEAKQQLADVLQQQLGGPTSGSPTSDFYKYRLVAINGPAYPVGSILAADNQLDVITRDCIFAEGTLPVENWTSMPRWSSNSNLDLDLGIPAPFTGLLNKAETSVDTGFKLSRSGVYQIEDISQTFLSRFELAAYLSAGDCANVLKQIDEPVIFVRGMIYGRETLRSARGFALGVDAQIVEGESGQLQMSYDNSGAYELAETEIRPKFAIMAKIEPRPATALPALDNAVIDPAQIQVTGARVVSNPLNAQFSVSELSDEEIAGLETTPAP